MKKRAGPQAVCENVAESPTGGSHASPACGAAQPQEQEQRLQVMERRLQQLERVVQEQTEQLQEQARLLNEQNRRTQELQQRLQEAEQRPLSVRVGVSEAATAAHEEEDGRGAAAGMAACAEQPVAPSSAVARPTEGGVARSVAPSPDSISPAETPQQVSRSSHATSRDDQITPSPHSAGAASSGSSTPPSSGSSIVARQARLDAYQRQIQELKAAQDALNHPQWLERNLRQRFQVARQL